MKQLLMREWNRERKGWITFQAIVMIASLLIFVLYLVGNRWLFRLMDLVKSLPAEVYGFIGLPEGVVTGNCAFFLLYFMMVMHLIWIWNGCGDTLRSVYADEECGMSDILYNQWYSRKQMFFAKNVIAVMRLVCGGALWYLELTILFAAKGFHGAQLWENIGLLLGMGIKAVFVFLLLLLVTDYLGMKRSRGSGNVDGILSGVLLGTLVLGNVYKVFDLLSYVMEYAGRDGSVFAKISGGLSYLYWISPLSWLNPFTQKGLGFSFAQILLCVILSMLLFVAVIHRVEKRS